MIVNFTDRAIKDIELLKKEDKKLVAKFLELIIDIDKNPYIGIGKPEALKHDLSGYWSRRINEKNRLIYCIENDYIKVISCFEHYEF